MNQEFSPKIVGFLCNWCSYAGADLAGVSRLQMPASLRTVRVMCSSRIDPVFVLKAFLRGADGVLVAGCHPGDCHYQRGNYYARRRFAMLRTILDQVGLESQRIRLSWVSASEGPRFAEVIAEFTDEIKKMGASSAKHEVFL